MYKMSHKLGIFNKYVHMFAPLLKFKYINTNYSILYGSTNYYKYTKVSYRRRNFYVAGRFHPIIYVPFKYNISTNSSIVIEIYVNKDGLPPFYKFLWGTFNNTREHLLRLYTQAEANMRDILDKKSPRILIIGGRRNRGGWRL